MKTLAAFLLIVFQSPVFAQIPITLEDIFLHGKFRGDFLMGNTWIPGDAAYSFLKRNTETSLTDIWRYDLKSGKESLLISAGQLRETPRDSVLDIDHYEWTSDGRFLVFTGTLTARSLKTGGYVALFDRKENRFRQVSSDDGEYQIVQLSPDGKKIGFVRDHNLFVMDLATRNLTQLTTDGTDQILNGHFDWVYEEEFSVINGWQWSPDSRSIAFWRLDQTRVPRFQIPLYTGTYPETNDYKYPKAGEANSLVSIGVVNIDDGKTRWVDLGKDQDIYVPRIQWVSSSGKLAVQRLNRLQNQLDLIIWEPQTGNQTTVLTEKAPAWLEINDNLTFLNSGSFIWSSEKDGYNHLYLHDQSGKMIRQLTSGSWEVDQVQRVDEKAGLVYFTAARESPMNRDLYQVTISDGKLTRLTRDPGFHRVNLHPDAPYFIDNHSHANQPGKTYLVSLKGEKIRTLVENPMSSMKSYSLPEVRFLTIPAADGTPMNAWMIRPADFDSTKRYPVLQFVYGGPGSQQVLNAWIRDYFWYAHLTQKGYVIVCADNRGTGFRGRDFRTVTYKKLGTIETDDQIAAARWLGSRSWVDSTRIGIWGWSYGGYLSSYSLFKGNDVFKAAIAVAPVSDWKFYDTIYTERFMQTPQLNPEGYQSASTLTWAKQLKGHFLLVHGTADDNVHFQNAVELADELIANGLQFDTMFYPDRYHGITGGKARYHLFTYMTNWLVENL